MQRDANTRKYLPIHPDTNVCFFTSAVSICPSVYLFVCRICFVSLLESTTAESSETPGSFFISILLSLLPSLSCPLSSPPPLSEDTQCKSYLQVYWLTE